jgi:hypothetical protein
LRERFSVAANTPPLDGLHAPDDEGDEDETGLAVAVDNSREAAASVFAVIELRAALLGARYPFALRDGHLVYVGRDDLRHNYLVLLALTLVHAYDLTCPVIPEQYLEDFVTEVLRRRGYLAVNLARHRRAGANFEEILVRAANACEISATPEAATRRSRAQEEGCDVLAHFTWQDTRRLHWILVVQVTCAVSDEWEKKMHDASAPMWRKLLGNLPAPQIVLAVPHHVTSSHLYYLYENTHGEHLVLDRIRLTRPDDIIDASGETLLAVLAELSSEDRAR